MQISSRSAIFAFDSRPGPRRPNFEVHRGRLAAAPVPPTLEPSPLHSVQTFVTTMFVVSIAVCWVAVASTATAPLVAAGEFLSRAAGRGAASL